MQTDIKIVEIKEEIGDDKNKEKHKDRNQSTRRTSALLKSNKFEYKGKFLVKEIICVFQRN